MLPVLIRIAFHGSVWYCVTSVAGKGRWLLRLSLNSNMFVRLPFPGVIGRLCSVAMALPGHRFYFFCSILWRNAKHINTLWTQEMRSVMSDLGLHCVLRTVCPNT